MNLRKDGFIPKKGSFIVLFYKSDENKLICRFMFRESKMTKKTPKMSFFVNIPNRSEKEITYHRLVEHSDSFTSVNITSSLVNLFVFLRRLKRA